MLQLQMSWQQGQKRKTGPPLGLKNLGNSCYLNSVLQCLTYTPPLANFCLRFQHSSLCDSASDGNRKRDCPFCILERRIVRSLSLDQTLDAPAKIQSCLRIFAEHFKSGRQEDAHEFLRYVIDACHNTCLRLKKLRRKGADPFSGSTTVVKEIFGGALQSQVKCLSCGAESNKVDEIMDISLDILHSGSVKQAMQKFFQPEVLDGNNKYKCENCKKLVAARKQMSILQAPNILVIQLKRFEGIFGGKIDKAIAFEEVLVLSSFMCKASQDPRPQYNLFGTIVHSGYSPESGHYYAYIKDAMGRWYCCNDSYVTLSTLQEVLSEKVYILFFSRTNQRPASASTTLATNGVKSGDSNGSEASKSPKVATPKAVHTKPHVVQSSQKDNSTILKVEKVPSSPRVKFDILVNSGSKRVPPTGNGKVNLHKSQNMETNGVARNSSHKEKSQNLETNGVAKNSSHKEKSKNDTSLFINRNGSNQNEKVDAVHGENSRAFAVANENGENSRAFAVVNENGENSRAFAVANENGENSQAFAVANENGTTQSTIATQIPHGARSRVTTGRGPDHHELHNGGVNCHSDTSGSKRKSQEDSCILFARDTQSRAKVEELKEGLMKDASSVLRSCGWFDEVYSLMCLRKRLCVREAGNTPSGSDLKKLLIADAKATFISQIPESLKGDLIKRLQSFSQEK